MTDELKCCRYTAREDRYIRSRYGKVPAAEVAAKLGRSPFSVRTRAKRLGVRKNRKTRVGDAFGPLTVLSLWRKRSSPTKVETYALCRCECGASAEVRDDHLKGGHSPCGCRRGWLTESDKDFVRKNYLTMTNGELAAALGRPAPRVRNFVWGSGLKRPWNSKRQLEIYRGMRVGLWEVVSERVVPRADGNGRWRVRCRCTGCGKRHLVNGVRLADRETKGCRKCRAGRRPARVTAWGEAKTVREWLADPRCKAGHGYAVHNRLRIGWTPERAIGTPTGTQARS